MKTQSIAALFFTTAAHGLSVTLLLVLVLLFITVCLSLGLPYLTVLH